MHDQLDRFESLLADLLEISRFDAGAAQLETESTDLRVVVGAAVEAARPLARARGCEIVELFPDQPCVAACDPRRIERIVRNLLSNAIEHGEGHPSRCELPSEPPVRQYPCATSVVALMTMTWTGCSTGSGAPTPPGCEIWAAPVSGCPSRWRTLACTAGGWRSGVDRGRALFRLTLPRVAGQDLGETSPLPLDPTEVGV